jgi:hypothetical protein
MYTITSDIDVRDMARGAVLLGSGGGGDPYVGELYLRNQLAEGRSPQIMKASELSGRCVRRLDCGRGRSHRHHRASREHPHVVAASRGERELLRAQRSMR